MHRLTVTWIDRGPILGRRNVDNGSNSVRPAVAQDSAELCEVYVGVLAQGCDVHGHRFNASAQTHNNSRRLIPRRPWYKQRTNNKNTHPGDVRDHAR